MAAAPAEPKPKPVAPVAAKVVAPLVAVAVAQASPATEQDVAPSPAAPGPADHPSEAQDWLDETLAAPMRPSIPPEPAASPAAVASAPAPAPSATAEPPSPASGNIGLDKPQPTEIGRYVSAGTTYVMYSDGSIEAENESGVLRFPSMAALKAYIERQG
jgi:hypothetical protein